MPKLKPSVIATGLALALVTGVAACGANSKDTASAADATPSVPQATEAAKAKPSDSASVISSPSSSPEPSEAPSPSGPYEPATSKHPARNVPDPGPLPKVAKEKSKAGQIAFIEHWVKEMNYATEAGQPTPLLKEMTDSECDYCQKLEKSVAALRKKNAWVVGGTIRLTNLKAQREQSDPNEFVVTTQAFNDEFLVYTEDSDQPVQTVPSGEQPTGYVVLEWRAGKWIIKGLYSYAD